MDDRHVTPDLLWSIRRGERVGSTLIRRCVVHLCRLCPTCHREIRAALAQRRRERRADDGRYAESFRRAMGRLAGASSEMEEEEARSRGLARELGALPPSRRLTAVRDLPERFRGEGLAELLLEESRGCLPADHRRAEGFAELARAVLDHTPASPRAVAAYARATAHLGNARRISCRPEEAEELFAFSRQLLRLDEERDVLARAEVDVLQGSLLREQGHFTDAVARGSRAAGTFRQAGMKLEEARALVVLGHSLVEGLRPRALAQVTRQALRLCTLDMDPQLVLHARHNLALGLSDQGEHDEARRVDQDNHDLYERFADPVAKLRRCFLAGRIAAGLRDMERSEAALSQARAGFLQRRRLVDVALISLALAAVYVRTGRTAEAEALVGEAIPTLDQLGVDTLHALRRHFLAPLSAP